LIAPNNGNLRCGSIKHIANLKSSKFFAAAGCNLRLLFSQNLLSLKGQQNIARNDPAGEKPSAIFAR
jgi:hypothetical protein